MDPVTMAIIAAASSAQQGMAAKAEGEAAGRIADHNAAVSRQGATASRERSRFEQKRHAKKAKSILSSQKARQGAGGGDVASGANLDAMLEQTSELELESLLIGLEGREAAARHENQALMDQSAGQLARTRGKNAQTAGFIQAGTSLLGAYKPKAKLPGGGGGGGAYVAPGGINPVTGGKV